MHIIELNDLNGINIQYKSDLIISNPKYKNMNINIYMEMSREALLGFGKKMIRISNDNSIKEGSEFHTNPVGRCANQPLGFFIDTGSPDLIVLIDNNYDKIKQNKKYNSICNIKEKPIKYCVYPENDQDGWILEEHEIGRYNLANIIVKDIFNNDISRTSGDVIIKIGKKGIYEFGKHIITLANNFQKEKIYKIPCKNVSGEMDYNFGIFLEQNNLFIRCIEGKQLKYSDIY